MKNKKKRAAGRDVRAGYEKFSSFTRCSRRVFLCAYSELDDGKDGVGVPRAVQCLRR